MAGIKFNHKSTVGVLELRLPPTLIEWTYNLNTNTTPTYAGEVVQILSINFDKLIIEGQFGKEGPHGANLESTQATIRSSDVKIISRPIDEHKDFKSKGPYAIGLTQLTEYFRSYFAVASQGHDRSFSGAYNEHPMEISYQGTLDIEESKWLGYPTSFPSYKRSNENFAPIWHIEFEIFEEPKKIRTQIMKTEIERLRSGVGYQPNNKFSDPLGGWLPPDFATRTKEERANLLASFAAQLSSSVDHIFDHYLDMLPAYTDDDLNELIFGLASKPAIYDTIESKAIQKKTSSIERKSWNDALALIRAGIGF